MRPFFALLICLAAWLPASLRAQTTRADSAAILVDAAQRLERAGRASAAEALYRQVLERFGDTAAAAAARQRLGEVVASQAPPAPRSGRVELAVWMTTYGLWLGVATPAAFGADDPEPYGVGLLVGGPLGLLSGLRIARARGISEGQARAITFGGTWGTWQGLGWAQVLDLDGLECNGDVCTNNSAEETFAAMIGGGLAGILAGAIIAAKPVASGTASTVSFGALWGTWFGVATGVIADLEDDDLLLATLVGGDAGLLTTALLAPHWKLSRNRARLISISGVIGGLAGAGIDLIAQPDADETVIGIPLATSIAGLIAGTILTRDYDLTHAPGGEDAGALFTMDNGRFRMGTPQPLPVLEPVRRDGRTRFRPAARLTLLRATF